MSEKARANHKRKWSDDYILYGFALFFDKGAQKGKCVICCKILRSKSIQPSKLSNHFKKIHPGYMQYLYRQRYCLLKGKR